MPGPERPGAAAAGAAGAAAWLSILAGLAKSTALPLFILALRDEAAFLVAGPPPPPLGPAWLAAAAGFVAGHLHAFAAFWMLPGLFMVAAGVQLMRRKRWARAGLVFVCWFGILEGPLVAAFIYSVRRMLLGAEVAGGDALAAALLSRGWAAFAWPGICAILLALLNRTGQGGPADGQAEGQPQGA